MEDAHAGFRPARIAKRRSAAGKAYDFRCIVTPCKIGTTPFLFVVARPSMVTH
jgi:hypothetical protein